MDKEKELTNVLAEDISKDIFNTDSIRLAFLKERFPAEFWMANRLFDTIREEQDDIKSRRVSESSFKAMIEHKLKNPNMKIVSYWESLVDHLDKDGLKILVCLLLEHDHKNWERTRSK